MPITVPALLAVLALAFTLASIVTPRVPLWIAVLLLSIALLIGTLAVR